MPADPRAAGRKGGQSRSAAKIAAAKRNGFQKPAQEVFSETGGQHFPSALPAPEPQRPAVLIPAPRKEGQ